MKSTVVISNPVVKEPSVIVMPQKTGSVVISIILPPEKVAALQALLESNGGLTAAATDPTSPWRTLGAEVCQQLFPGTPWPADQYDILRKKCQTIPAG